MNESASSLRILIVDDDPVACDALRRLLRPLRSRDSLVCACAKAEDALSLASRVEFDVVLCDLHLEPTLAENNPALAARTILIADGARATRARAFWSGRRVLPKNAQAEELMTAIADVTGESIRAAS